MSVNVYERIWMWGAGGLIVLFLAAIGITAVAQAVQPPSHIETINPATLDEHPEFGDPQVVVAEDGRVIVSVVAEMFQFRPDPIEVPVNTPITFRITSADVVHGFQIVGTNANAMAVPGYVSQFTVTFDKAGDYDIACNEYCGMMHHVMVGKITVKGERP
ncbi:MAG: cupredoxin domain-containing protein [Acidobacteria bacterium]|jgi:cytochrome c oxidase subunit II|nr:cupredoxin domain-containing protein [Acidobacteriota bacterium]